MSVNKSNETFQQAAKNPANKKLIEQTKVDFFRYCEEQKKAQPAQKIQHAIPKMSVQGTKVPTIVLDSATVINEVSKETNSKDVSNEKALPVVKNTLKTNAPNKPMTKPTPSKALPNEAKKTPANLKTGDSESTSTPTPSILPMTKPTPSKALPNEAKKTPANLQTGDSASTSIPSILPIHDSVLLHEDDSSEVVSPVSKTTPKRTTNDAFSKPTVASRKRAAVPENAPPVSSLKRDYSNKEVGDCMEIITNMDLRHEADIERLYEELDRLKAESAQMKASRLVLQQTVANLQLQQMYFKKARLRKFKHIMSEDLTEMEEESNEESS
jgi:hypothetical protein